MTFSTRTRIRPVTAGRPARIIGRPWRTASAALLLALAGCSAVQLVYNNIQDAAYWWLDGYFDLGEAHSPRLRDDLARLHQWHRSTELPQYLPLLQRAEKLVAADTTPDAVCALTDAVRDRILPLLARVEAVAVPYATTLVPTQLAALQRKHAKLNTEYREDWLDSAPAKQHARRAKQYIERAEDLYGRLGTPQRELLRQQAADALADPRIDYAEKRRRQTDLLTTLTRLSAEPTPASDAQARLHAVAMRALQAPDAAVRSYQQAVQQQACANSAALHATTTTAQRQRAGDKLRGWQRDVAELAARP